MSTLIKSIFIVSLMVMATVVARKNTRPAWKCAWLRQVSDCIGQFICEVSNQGNGFQIECIEKTLLCNGVNNCASGSDEKDCSTQTSTTTAPEFATSPEISTTTTTASGTTISPEQIADGVAVGNVSNTELDEASGLCASRKHPGILYTHNDYGGQNRLFAINTTTAQVDAILVVNGATNTDWEDLACGSCVGHTNDFCVYIGDIGNGGNEGSASTLYRIQEPDTLTSLTNVNVEGMLHYTWNEKGSDTLLLTPDADLYIISKVYKGKGLIAHIPGGGWGSNRTVQAVGHLHVQVTSTHNDPVGGDISPDGQEVLVKTRDQVLHYSMGGRTDYQNVLAGTPTALPYIRERNGQSVAFSVDGNTYYTLGEGLHPTLYRYDMEF